MKQLLTIILFLCASLSCMAQKVVSDTYSKDGMRILLTDEKRLCQVQQFVVWAGLNAVINNGEVHYYVKLKYTGAYKMSTFNDASLLLKTFDDQVYNLHTYVGLFGGESKTEYTKYLDIEKLTQSYSINTSDLQNVFEKGVSKIRIQLDCKGESLHDKDFKEDKLAKILKNAYDAINKKIEESPTRKSITDGF